MRSGPGTESTERRGRDIDKEAPIHSVLRASTRHLHESLDTQLAYLVAPSLALDRYGDLLAAMYGFYVPIEQWLVALKSTTPPFPVPLVSRADRLRRDLSALGRSVERAALATWRDEATREHLAGAAYVLEGAALGSQIITRAVARSICVTAAHGGAFFAGEGPATPARFRRVIRWLDELVDGGADRVEIIAGAVHVFEGLLRWLTERGVLSG